MREGVWISHITEDEDGRQQVVLSSGEILCGVLGSPHEGERRVSVIELEGDLPFVDLSVAVRNGHE